MDTTEGATPDVLILDGVSAIVTNDNGNPVMLLDDIELSFGCGQWLNIVGVNGSGKSTLARIVAGLHLQGTTGQIHRGFAGESASPIVLQRPESQLFGETPREEVLFALEWREVPSHEIQDRAEQVLSMTGLLDIADVRWEVLSGGQRQLAAVAAAAACGSRMIVFDEATSMLDEWNRRAVLNLARDLHRRGTAVVWVTQRLDELLPVDRVIAMEAGRITYDGDVRTFFYGEQTADAGMTPCQSCGLRLPYMSALALQLRKQGRLSGDLPVTQKEWREVWGNAGKGTASGS